MGHDVTRLIYPVSNYVFSISQRKLGTIKQKKTLLVQTSSSQVQCVSEDIS